MSGIPELPDWAERSVTDYLNRIAVQRGLSPHTVAAYERDLRQFFDFCDRLGIRTPEEVDRRTGGPFVDSWPIWRAVDTPAVP
jgi:site-specific recombinase XerD